MMLGPAGSWAAAYPDASVTHMTWRWSNVPLPERFLGALGAGALLHLVVPLRLPLPGPSRLAGGALVATGAGLVAWSVASAADTTVDSPQALVTKGAYAVTRNPMYLGWGVAVLGAVLLSRNAWLAIAWLHAARSVHHEVLEEERSLAARFGASFEHYRASRPRYLPQLRALILRPWPRTA